MISFKFFKLYQKSRCIVGKIYAKDISIHCTREGVGAWAPSTPFLLPVA